MTPEPLSAGAVPPVPRSPRPLWKRILILLLKVLGGGLAVLLVLGGVVWWMQSTGRLIPMILRIQASRSGEGGDPLERNWPDAGAATRTRIGLRRDAGTVAGPSEFLEATRVWEVRMTFTADQWKAMQPKSVPAKAAFDAPDGKFALMNTNASRNGLLGAIGLDLDWTRGEVEVGGVSVPDAAVRFKGNGTFLGALSGVKRPLKVDLGKSSAKAVAGVSVLNLGNLSSDYSCVSDALAYEFFREAGVPSPRTAFAHVTVTAGGRWTNRPYGLYVVVENVDARFLAERPLMGRCALFKPVTYELFRDLGPDWQAYQRIYDGKVGLDDAAKARVIETARFVTSADDATFAAKAGDFFDLDEVARFVAVNALLSSFDGFLNNGQNFHMYLNKDSGRFGFIPWDLDRAWGEFPFIGSLEEKERASITRPWVADHRLMERLFAMETFRNLYRTRLEEIFRRQWDVERLSRRMDALVPVVRSALVDESDLRIRKFEEAVTADWRKDAPPAGPPDMSPTRPAHQLRRFFAKRRESVEAQLAGKEKGVEFLTRLMPGSPPEKK